MVIRTRVASDLRRASHESSSIYSGFVPDAGTSQDLLCEAGAQSHRGGRLSDMRFLELTLLAVRGFAVPDLTGA